MGSADELQPYSGLLGPKHPRKHPIERVATQVVVAVTTHGGEMVGADPLRLKRRQNLGQLGLHRCSAALSHNGLLRLSLGNSIPGLSGGEGPGGGQNRRSD